jgi:hypothetical protein
LLAGVEGERLSKGKVENTKDAAFDLQRQADRGLGGQLTNLRLKVGVVLDVVGLGADPDGLDGAYRFRSGDRGGQGDAPVLLEQGMWLPTLIGEGQPLASQDEQGARVGYQGGIGVGPASGPNSMVEHGRIHLGGGRRTAQGGVAHGEPRP